MSIKKVFVAGSGVMGLGILQACAQAGYSVKKNEKVKSEKETGK